MAWNGAGTFVLNPSFSPEVTGTVVDATRYNGLTGDIATGITQTINKNGENVPTANLGMGSFKHTGAGAATAAGQYLVYGQVSAVLDGLSITTTLTGAGVTARFASPGPIGTTAPGVGRFTQASTPEVAITFSATAMVIPCASSNVFRTTFTANVTVAPTFTGLQDGQTINWFITQDATGSRTMTWPSSFRWPTSADKLLSTAANSVDLLIATYRSTTGFWYVSLVKTFIA
jgi:hypothetical protein